VIISNENVCPRFLPRELGIEVDVEEEASSEEAEGGYATK